MSRTRRPRTSVLTPLLPHRWRRPLPRLLFGLVLFGWGAAAMVLADLGLGPWDAFHQGLSFLTGIPIGTVGILVSVLLLLLWIPLHERPGIGTLCNVVVIGVTIDLTLWVVPEPEALPVRILAMLAGPVLIGVGSGFYLGANLGPGPRDGLMTGLARRGWPVGRARATIEITVLVLGWLLGGRIGVGTVLFAVTIGPLVAWSLPRLVLPEQVPAAR